MEASRPLSRGLPIQGSIAGFSRLGIGPEYSKLDHKERENGMWFCFTKEMSFAAAYVNLWMGEKNKVQTIRY